MESRSFPFGFGMARRYDKHLMGQIIYKKANRAVRTIAKVAERTAENAAKAKFEQQKQKIKDKTDMK